MLEHSLLVFFQVIDRGLRNVWPSSAIFYFNGALMGRVQLGLWTSEVTGLERLVARLLLLG
jgi:hypothetical protein